MKIKVIFTGGTIGSKFDGDYIAPEQSTKFQLIESYKAQFGDAVKFETESPYTILSENLGGELLSQLLACVKKSLKGRFDGIIVTHGTDTLQYSAAALGYAFADSEVPIVLVSSNFPLDDPRANGQANFNAAVTFIGKARSGVFVSYKNDEKVEIHCATRLLRHAEYSDKAESVGGACVGFVDGEAYTPNGSFAYMQDGGRAFGACDLTRASVMLLTAHVGLKYPDTLDDTDAVLISSYHSGTICTESEEFKRFCTLAAEKQVPLFLTGAKAGAQYESTRVYHRSDINVLPKMSTVAAYMKLWLACCEKKEYEHIVRRMNEPLAKDFIVESGI